MEGRTGGHSNFRGIQVAVLRKGIVGDRYRHSPSKKGNMMIDSKSGQMIETPLGETVHSYFTPAGSICI